MLRNADTFRKFLQGSKKLQKFSSATRVAERWQRYARPGKFRHFFLDDIAARPDDVRRDVLILLGADPQKSSGLVDPDYNRKSEHKKLEFTKELEAVLAEFLKDELRSGAAKFGGHATEWAAKYGF